MAGSRPDRFDALARNLYWLNVTRFFAGRYSKGELPSLIERLDELAATEYYDRVAHPRFLTATLLADWVFTQSPRSVKDAVRLILAEGKIRFLIVANSVRFRRRSASFSFTLPARCGREELIEAAYALLDEDIKSDYEEEIIGLLLSNIDSPSELLPGLLSRLSVPVSVENKLKWAKRGFELGLLSEVNPAEISGLLGAEISNELKGILLYKYGHFASLNDDEALFESTVDSINERDTFPRHIPFSEQPLDALHAAFDKHQYSLSFLRRDPVPLAESLSKLRHRSGKPTVKSPVKMRSYPAFKKCAEVKEIAETQLQLPSATWATSIAPWDTICEAGRTRFGDKWALVDLANTAAGIKSKIDKCSEFNDLLDASSPLCRRVRHARLRSSNISWWTDQIRRAESANCISLVLLVLLTWGQKRTLKTLTGEIEIAIDKLSFHDWKRVFISSRYTPYRDMENKDFYSNPEELPTSLSERLACFYASRAQGRAWESLAAKHFKSSEQTDEIGQEFVMRFALDEANLGKAEWAPDLDLVKTIYRSGYAHEPAHFFRVWHRFEVTNMPFSIASRIADSPLEFPAFLISIAEEACRVKVTETLTPVSTIAARDGWFSDSYSPGQTGDGTSW